MYWIRIKTNLSTCPEVVTIASRMSVTDVTHASRMHVTVGALVATWSYLDTHGLIGERDAIVENFDFAGLDHVVGIPGWSELLVHVGWLRVDGTSLVFPNYGINNSPTSKQRYLAQQRQNRHRHSSRSSVTDVTHDRDKSNSKKRREEKRRDSNTDSVFSSGDKSPSENPSSVSAVAQSTTPVTPPEPSILEFPTNGPIRSWSLTQRQIDEWSGLYSGLDVLVECRKALAWVQANQRKTAKGMPRFLTSWLARACDRMALKPTIPAKGRSMTAQEIEAASRPFIQTFYKANDLTGTNGVHPPIPVEPSPWDD